LALVTVAVDPPLSQHDLELIKELHRYTSNVYVLLTKIDSINDRQRAEIESYVRVQLLNSFGSHVPLLRYSTHRWIRALISFLLPMPLIAPALEKHFSPQNFRPCVQKSLTACISMGRHCQRNAREHGKGGLTPFGQFHSNH
jgi:hypothetical protein